MSLRSILGELAGGRTRPRKIGVGEVRALQDRGAVLLDVRSRQEYRTGHAQGARNIPLDQLAERMRKLPIGTPIVTICQSGGRSARAAGILTRHGRQDVYDVRGGMTSWQRTGLPIERS